MLSFATQWGKTAESESHGTNLRFVLDVDTLRSEKVWSERSLSALMSRELDCHLTLFEVGDDQKCRILSVEVSSQSAKLGLTM